MEITTGFYRMTKASIMLALMLGLACPLSQAADEPKASTTTAGEQTKAAKPAESSTQTSSDDGSKEKIKTKKHAKHEKKVAHKEKSSKHAIDGDISFGDGRKLSKIGARKKVDSGFDFDNSKTFHQ